MCLHTSSLGHYGDQWQNYSHIIDWQVGGAGWKKSPSGREHWSLITRHPERRIRQSFARSLGS